MNDVLVAAISGAAGVATGAALRQLPHLGSGILARVRDDHTAISGGWHAAAGHNTEGAYVVIRCAPAQRQPPVEPDVTAALAFASDALDGRAGADADVESGQRVMFDVRDVHGGIGASCLLWSYGLIELRLPVETVLVSSDEYLVSAGAVAEAALLLANPIHDGWYTRLYRRRRLRPLRLDWSVGVTQSVFELNQRRDCRGLAFPGPPPGFTPTRATPPAGARAITSQPLRTRPVAVATACVRAAAHEAGYRDCAAAVALAVAEGTSRLNVSRQLHLASEGRLIAPPSKAH